MSTSTASQNAFVDFKEVKSRIGILQVLERYGLLSNLKRAADRLSGPCPLHKGTNPTQFRVSVSRNCFNCFGTCGRGGNVIDFVSLREGISFRDAALLLQDWFMPDKAANRFAGTAPRQTTEASPRPSSQPLQPPPAVADDPDEDTGENPPLSFALKALKSDHPYLSARGLTEATIASYGIGYCAKGCLRGHVAIPIRNRDGVLTGYIGRWPGDPPQGQGKYKLPKGFRKSREVFNIDRAVHADSSDPLLVVEGVFDCLHLVQLGFSATVAILGSSLSPRQEILIREAARTKRPVYLLFDADEAGRKGASEAAMLLCSSSIVRIIDIGAYQPQPELLERSQVEALLTQHGATTP
ncbi:DNA primase [Prosthecobacter fusiformis]|uniref:DNA primase n=1 Tax=Prosthecobacter fusiformis TaxID=48464 RepID=A0A4R7SRM0_9BACT|nr:CHC2 zinc finger domain-containing protein [Prosthecobacter fusiformis]TDU80798.1 DNA primase [Prosthecobacter fusiformis]